MTFDTAALTAAFEKLQATLARAKETGENRAAEDITSDLLVLMMDLQMHLTDAFAAAMVDHERRLIAIEAELQGTVE